MPPSPRWHVANRVQQIEPAVGFDVEDQVELAWILIGQEVAAFQAGSVQQHVNVARSFRTCSMTLATPLASARFTLK